METQLLKKDPTSVVCVPYSLSQFPPDLNILVRPVLTATSPARVLRLTSPLKMMRPRSSVKWTRRRRRKANRESEWKPRSSHDRSTRATCSETPISMYTTKTYMDRAPIRLLASIAQKRACSCNGIMSTLIPFCVIRYFANIWHYTFIASTSAGFIEQNVRYCRNDTWNTTSSIVPCS